MIKSVGSNKVTNSNRLFVKFPDLFQEWSDRNQVPPDEITYGSRKKRWWVCSKGHEWLCTPLNRSNGSGCPFCSGRLPIVGETDLGTTHPHLVEQWADPVLGYSSVSFGSTKRVRWRCEYGHTWVATPNDRTNHGNNCPVCSGRKIEIGFNDLPTVRPDVLVHWDYNNNNISPYEVTEFSTYRASWVCDLGHRWVSNVHSKSYYSSGCPKCLNRTSSAEKDITSFLPESLSNCRNVIPPYELDIYLPKNKIAIEYNGLYWHTEESGRGKWYHHNKWKMCADKGIQLITIWEDDWNRNPELVKRMLLNKLGISEELTVFARKTTIVPITKEQSRPFLEENHIQGISRASVHLGMYYMDNLVAVMLLTRIGSEWTLDRYATSCNVPGGHSKMLEYFKNNYEWTKIKTFADLCISDGDLYEKTGWIRDAVLDPDYCYIYRGIRVHKFNFRLSRFRNDPNLLWEDGLSEKELAKLNGLHKVWDCGKLRYVLENDNVKR